MRNDAPEMNLPPGKTCNECRHIGKCEAMFGAERGNTHCDFSPSRFSQTESCPLADRNTKEVS